MGRRGSLFTTTLRCGNCGYQWSPRRSTLYNGMARCPGCGQRSEIKSGCLKQIGCLFVLLFGLALVVSIVNGTRRNREERQNRAPATVESPDEK